MYDKIRKEVILTRGNNINYKCKSSSGWIRESGQLQKFFPISEKEANKENTDISIVKYYANMIW